jgi:hypothetical protein
MTGRKGVVVLTDGIQTDPKMAMKNRVIAGRSLARVPDPIDDKGFQTALKVVRSSDVVFYFVAVNTDLNPDPSGDFSQGGLNRFSSTGIYDPSGIYNMQQFRLRMQLVAEATGGRLGFPKSPSDVGGLYEDIARELGTNYTLWYSPVKASEANDTREREIQVRVKTAGLQIRQNRYSYTPTAPTK